MDQDPIQGGVVVLLVASWWVPCDGLASHPGELVMLLIAPCWVPCDGLASHPGGNSNTPVASCYRNWVKLWQCVLLGLSLTLPQYVIQAEVTWICWIAVLFTFTSPKILLFISFFLTEKKNKIQCMWLPYRVLIQVTCQDLHSILFI